MKRTKLFVFDTNTLTSAFIFGSDTNATAFDKARAMGRVVVSSDTRTELSEVFLRPRFDLFVRLEDRIDFLGYFDRQALLWPNPLISITICRDPKDNMYLELAVACRASCIVTGDKDLLVLHPFRGIPIITASDFLEFKF